MNILCVKGISFDYLFNYPGLYYIMRHKITSILAFYYQFVVIVVEERVILFYALNVLETITLHNILSVTAQIGEERGSIESQRLPIE